MNVAVTAKRLLAFEGQQSDKPPPNWKCAWNIRAEQLAPETKMQQWTVRDEKSVAEALEYLQNLIGKFVIPRVTAMLSENARFQPVCLAGNRRATFAV